MLRIYRLNAGTISDRLPGCSKGVGKGIPYAVFFVVRVEEIVVISCMHTRRNPKRWHGRREPSLVHNNAPR